MPVAPLSCLAVTDQSATGRCPRTVAWVFAGLLVAFVAGCGPAFSSHAAGDRQPAGNATGPSASASAAASGPNDAMASAPAAPGQPTQDVSSTAAAVAAAQEAMTVFARPTIDPGTWFADLAPLLTPEARSAYYGTDPANVPAHAITAPGRAEASPSAYLAHVTVPTDVGDYRVLLSRQDGSTGWLVETLTPPDGVH